MLDVEMLDTMAAGKIPYRDGKPVFLENVFDIVKADGWHPRNPAGMHELGGLRQSVIGVTDCLAPLVQPGDLIFSDPNMQALPGDIVCFALSERGAKAQNGDGPLPGQRVWRRGDGWAKLYCRYHGFDMLLTRHDGQSMTATLACCEDPDEKPVLHPVRQVIRNGVPLFSPIAHCGQIGANAASTVATNYSVPAVNVTNTLAMGSGSVTAADIISITHITYGTPIAIDVISSVTLTGGGTPGSSFTLASLEVYVDGASIGSTVWDGTALGNYGGGATIPDLPVMFTASTSGILSGTHTISLHAKVSGTGSIWSVTMSCANTFIKVREYRR